MSLWKNRSVFLTGHTGFKGSWLALWLAQMGAKVHGYALDPPSEPSNFEASRVAEMLASHTIGDIRDHDRLLAAMKRARPDAVFHLAAQPLVRLSYETPRETFDVNVLGTASVLDAVRALGTPCTVLVITSDKCYENREHVWGYRECDAMGGYDPYSASKGAAEVLVASYRRSFFHPEKVAQHGVKLASVRAGNVIGGGDWAKDRIVTDVVAALAAGRPVPVRSPLAIRPWQHVLEPLSGYLALAEKMIAENDPRWCDGWNFGPVAGDERPVRDLVETFVAAWGSGSWDDQSNGQHPHEAKILRLCIDKARAELGWRPRWNFEEAVNRTARWFQRHHRDPTKPMDEACREDIAAYVSARKASAELIEV